MLLALLAAALLHPYDPFPAPALTLIEAARDTVWFTAPATDWSPAASYAYVRATGTWVRYTGVARARVPQHLPARPGDSVDVAPGWTLLRLPDREEGVAGGYVLVSSRDGRRIPVAADMRSPAVRATIRGALSDFWMRSNADSLPAPSLSITRWARDEGGIWFGFDGGQYEIMEGDLAVLLRFDLATGKLEVVATPELADAHVSGLAIAGDRVWVGTQYARQLEGIVGEHGVLVRGLRGGPWRAITSHDGSLPGDLIHAVVADRGALWVTSDGGISRLDLATGTWSSAYFTLAMRGDSVVHELTTTRPPHPRTGVTILTLAELLGAPRRVFWDAASALPAERFDIFVSLDDEEWDVSAAPAALAHPALVPFLREAVRRGGAGRDAAIEALGLLGTTDALSLVSAAFDSGHGSARVTAALAMARLGDSTGVRYLRNRLADTVPTGEDDRTIEPVIHAVVELRDREGLRLLGPWLNTPSGAPAAFAALADRSDLAGWRMLARRARENASLRSSLLTRVARCDSGCSDPVNDPEIRALVGELARRALADPRQSDLFPAGAIAVRYGDPAFMPYLIGGLTMSMDHYAASVRALIRLTGIDTVPATVEPTPEERIRAQRFFAAWWAANQRGFRPVPRPVGEAALLRWYDRPRGRIP